MIHQDICKYIYKHKIKYKDKNMLSVIFNYRFKLDFQKSDQDTGGKWLIHGTKHCNGNQLRSLKLPGEYSSCE